MLKGRSAARQWVGRDAVAPAGGRLVGGRSQAAGLSPGAGDTTTKRPSRRKSQALGRPPKNRSATVAGNPVFDAA